MKFKKLESGRSMVEMLGVLAIIGVLSVGGIAGYSLSMRRHRANSVVDFVSKYALVTYSVCQQALMDGRIKSIDSCNDVNERPYYADAGIGAVPAGISSIALWDLTTDQTTGVDTIRMGVSFTDEKLCQAVASITGSSWIGSECSNIPIKIKQN